VISVDFSTVNGSAIGAADVRVPSDFTPARGTLTFAAEDDAAKRLPIEVRGDRTHEDDESFLVELTSVDNANLGSSQAEIKIVDNDPVPALSISGTTVREGKSGATTAELSVNLSNPTSSDVTFTVSTSDGTASAGSDYQAIRVRPGSIPAGQSTTSTSWATRRSSPTKRCS
jgi:Calx-beta domain